MAGGAGQWVRVRGVVEATGAWGTGVRIGVLCGGLTSVASAVAVGRVWATCDVGSNTSANSLALAMAVPVVWAAVILAWVFVCGVVGRVHRGVALTVGVLLNAWLFWFTVVELGALDAYPDPVCPGNIPPWWPSLIPA